MTNEQSINRKIQIKNVASELFLALGFDATSMDRIAKSAEVSKRTPYIYFASKHDLFSAVIRGYLKELELLLEPLWEQPGKAVDVIKACVSKYADYAIENPDKFKLIMTFEKRDFYPGRKQEFLNNEDACQKINDRLTLNLQVSVDRAISLGELQTNMTAEQYSLLLWSALSGIISIALERDEILNAVYNWSAQEMVASFVENFINNQSKDL